MGTVSEALRAHADAVARRHIRRSKFGWQLTSDQRLVGRFEWDPESDGRVSLVVIDGEAFSCRK